LQYLIKSTGKQLLGLVDSQMQAIKQAGRNEELGNAGEQAYMSYSLIARNFAMVLVFAPLKPGWRMKNQLRFIYMLFGTVMFLIRTIVLAAGPAIILCNLML
jgi:hypothetical protein